MPGLITWGSGSSQISLAMQLSGQGNQLANAAAVALGTVLDNTGASGGPNFFGLAELVASASGYGAALPAGNTIDFYLVPSRDGTNYMNADVTGAVLPANHYRGSFVVTVSGNNQARLGLEFAPLMPTKYTGYVKNNLGQLLASGWSMFITTYPEAYT